MLFRYKLILAVLINYVTPLLLLPVPAATPTSPSLFPSTSLSIEGEHSDWTTSNIEFVFFRSVEMALVVLADLQLHYYVSVHQQCSTCVCLHRPTFCGADEDGATDDLFKMCSPSLELLALWLLGKALHCWTFALDLNQQPTSLHLNHGTSTALRTPMEGLPPNGPSRILIYQKWFCHPCQTEDWKTLLSDVHVASVWVDEQIVFDGGGWR